MEDLPERYVPSSLRPTMYGIGFADGDDYAMTHGPVPDIFKLLDIVPEDDEQRREMLILQLSDTDGKHIIIYRWRTMGLEGDDKYWELNRE